MIDATNEGANEQRAAQIHDDTFSTPTVATAPASADSARRPAARSARLTYDQFLLGQLPLILTLALVFGVIAYAAGSQLSTGGAATGGGTAVGAGDAPITAFASGTAAQVVAVAADPSGALKWDRATYEAQAGDVTFVVTNKSSIPHNFAVEGPNVTAQGPNFGANTTTTYTLRGLKPGEYQIVCNFPGHKAAGMVARLIVT